MITSVIAETAQNAVKETPHRYIQKCFSLNRHKYTFASFEANQALLTMEFTMIADNPEGK
jgi:hypothetical protein